MNIRKHFCIIVDAYSTANKLAAVIRAYGYQCIHIQSSVYLPGVLTNTFIQHDFIDHFVCETTAEKLLQQIKQKKYNIKCVIAGAETGVILADYLAEQLCVPGNQTSYSMARRDKFQMAETLKNAGINHIQYTKANNVEDALAWVSKKNLESIVIKPLLSSGTYGFNICHSKDEMMQTFHLLHNTKDIFGNVNHELLIQEYIQGQEFCINVVSHQGHNYISEIWKTDKVLCSHSKVYDLETLVAEDSAEFNILTMYITEVLKALKIEYGASHSEVIIDSNTGLPVLIETAARFMGSLDLSLVTAAYGSNAVLLTAESYLEPDNFIKLVRQRKTKPMKKYPAMVQLISQQQGQLEKYNLDKLLALKTFHGIDIYTSPGGNLTKTINSYSSPGLVFLLGENEQDVRADYRSIRAMEAQGKLYTLK